MRQYQYRMKCRKAPNQNWSSWGDCSLGSAYHYLEDAEDESNIWTYEVREIVPVTEIINENPSMTAIMIEHTAILEYTRHVRTFPKAPKWADIPLAERKFWINKVKTSMEYANAEFT